MSVLRVASLALVASIAFVTQAFAQNDAISRDTVRNYQVQRTRPDVAIDPRNRPPRFIVEAISFRAVDESHYSWMGSDHVFGWWATTTTSMATRNREVDTNDTEQFLPTQSCITPAVDPDRRRNGQWRCDPAGVAAPLAFTVRLYEDDVLPDSLPGFSVCGSGIPQNAGTDLNWCPRDGANDTLLDAELRYELSDIQQRLRPSCRCFNQTITSSLSDSTYQLTIRITMVDPGGGGQFEQGPGGGVTTPTVLRSGSLTARQNERFEFDAGAIVTNGGDFSFTESGNQLRLTPLNGARIWVGNATARGYAGCAAGAANHVTTAVQVPAAGTYACYITSDGHIGELRITTLTPGMFGQLATLVLAYTTWQ